MAKQDSIRNAVRGLMIEAVKSKDARIPKERLSSGEALREKVPLASHATWEAPEDRPDPVALLREQGESRIQALLPLRYERMSASAFTFYRGAALIMASDLSRTPVTGIEVQACGDAHISNFGLFNSPERHTVFDINDFDETALGPWEWDVKRLAASVEICGLDRGFKKKERKAAILACARGYRMAMNAFARMGNLDVWYAHLNVDTIMGLFHDKLSKKQLKQAKKILGKAKGKNSSRAAAKLTEVVDGKLRIVSNPPTVVALRDLAADPRIERAFSKKEVQSIAKHAFEQYFESIAPDKRRLIKQYQGVDIAIKVVGVGSVGTRALIVVMEGSSINDPLVLQVKEAEESVLERFCGKSPYEQHGQRVVEGQRAIQTASDMLLGWCRLPGVRGATHDYYVRQLWDGKGSVDLSEIEPDEFEVLSAACGAVLAHSHARTGDRFEIAGYLGDTDEFDNAMVKFARAYAKQNEADYQRLLQALEAGEL